MREGGSHPDRDAQFRHMNESARAALAAGDPVISVDAKKELAGDFKKPGRAYRPQGEPEEARVYDFLVKELGSAVPYGTCDLTSNAGWVSVGTSCDTSTFAVQTIRRWWQVIVATTTTTGLTVRCELDPPLTRRGLPSPTRT